MEWPFLSCGLLRGRSLGSNYGVACRNFRSGCNNRDCGGADFSSGGRNNGVSSCHGVGGVAYSREITDTEGRDNKRIKNKTSEK